MTISSSKDVSLVDIPGATAMAMPRASPRGHLRCVPGDTRYADGVTRGAVALLAMLTATPRGASADTATLAKEVAKVRGLPLKKPIEQVTVSREELRARLLKLAGERKTQDEL